MIWFLYLELGPSVRQGSTKVSRVSKITETPIFHGNFSLEIMYKCPKKGFFYRTSFGHRSKLLYQKKNFFVTEMNLCNRQKKSQKQVSVRPKILPEKNNSSGYKFSLQRQVNVHVAVRETYFGHRRKKTLLSQKKVSVTEIVLPQRFLSEKKASIPEERRYEPNILGHGAFFTERKICK